MEEQQHNIKNSQNIELNVEIKETSKDNNNESNKNNDSKNKKLKLIIIISIIAIIIAFIFILIFVILKDKDDEDDENDDKIPIILDVDEGGDDMVTYTIANNSRKYEILGITTVSPSYCLEDVTNMWLRFLKYMDFDTKVYKGENHPLVRQSTPITFFHDYGIEFPSTTKTAEKKNAIDFMIETIKNHKKKITLFLLGPLTNFAKAYQKDKSIINNIEEIIIMGGAKYDGNMEYNSKAEYNIYMDVDAANIVFNCGIKIKVMGTSVTHQIEFTDEIYEKFKNFNTKSSLLTYYVMKGTFATWNDNYLHDPATILYHLDNNIITLKDYYCYVNDTNPDVFGTNYGTMVFNEPTNENKANIQYSESVDLDLYWETLEKYVKKY